MAASQKGVTLGVRGGVGGVPAGVGGDVGDVATSGFLRLRDAMVEMGGRKKMKLMYVIYFYTPAFLFFYFFKK